MPVEGIRQARCAARIAQKCGLRCPLSRLQFYRLKFWQDNAICRQRVQGLEFIGRFDSS